MEKRQLSDKYREMGEHIIDTFPELQLLKTSNVRIAFLESDYNKKSGGAAVWGECEKVQPKNQWAIDYDFTVTVFVKNIIGISKEQEEALLLHELLHIGIDYDGDEKYSIIDHDLKDFRAVIEKYGIDWQKRENKE